MTFTFYVVDESLMPPNSARGTSAATPEAIISAIRERGGRWSTVDVDLDHFAEAFETVDQFAGGKGFLPELAFAGSPHHLLAGYSGRWRLGYIEGSLVHHVYGVCQLLSSEIDEAMDGKDEETRDTYRAFLSALEEADERNLAVAILHE